MRRLISKFAGLFGSAGINDGLREEIEAHILLRADENRLSGMSPEDALTEARRHFGNPVLTRELAREAWRFPTAEFIGKDLFQGLRGIIRAPGFSLAVILTLALGIGANTAIFSAVYNVLLRPLPYPSGERLVSLGESAGKATGISVTWLNYLHWRDETRAFERMAAFTRADLTLTGHGDSRLTHAGVVTQSFFTLTGWRAFQGRVFAQSDDRPGATPVAVLTWEFWNGEFGADPAVVGSVLALNGKPYEVVGVLKPAVRVMLRTADYYLPLGAFTDPTTNRGAHGSMRVLGLLKPGVTLSAAREDLDGIMRRLADSDPGPESSHRAYGEFLTDAIKGDVRRTLWMLMGAVGLLLLIACANVASLILVRGVSRAREIAIRTAIGAGRVRLVRQLLTENLVVVFFGGALGILLAYGSVRALLKLAPDNLPRLSEISVDPHVLLFALAITTLAGFLAAFGPILVSSSVDLTLTLKDGAQGSGTGNRGQSLRGAIVIAEIGVTVVLAFGAGLLIRSLALAQNAWPGFDARNVIALELQLPSSSYKRAAARRFYTDLVSALRHETGVIDAGMVTCPPGAGDCGDWWYSIADRPAPAKSDVPLTLFGTADPGYFHTMRIPLRAGRAFTDNDRAGSPKAVIVNEEIARKYWRNPQEAIGHTIKFGGPYQEGGVLEIVGVAGDVSQMGLDGERVPQMYLPFAQEGGNSMVVMIRSAGDPAALIPAIRRKLASLDRNLPIQSLGTAEDRLGATLQRRRFSTVLLASFAALAMLLAGIGIYGVLNYWVSLRNREIAVRMALGAPRLRIMRWTGLQAGRLVLAGIVAGLAGSWAASRLLTEAVYGVSARNPLWMALSAGAVTAIAAIAAGLPVWRASRVDVNKHLHES